MPSRRSLLRAALAGVAATALPRPARGAVLPSVLVVGAGPAGMSAALELSERGVPVTLVEAGAQVGGKVKGWVEGLDGQAVDVEHGVHGWWRQYVHFRELLERHGLGEALRPFRHREQALVSPQRELRTWLQRVDAIMEASGLRGPRFLRRYREGVGWLRATPVAELRASLGGRSAAQWVAGGAPLTVYTAFAELMAWSMYFLPPDRVDAATFAMGERFYFTGTPRNEEVSWLRGNPETLIWQPLVEVLRQRGVALRLSSPVHGLLVEEGRVVGVRLGPPGEERQVAALDEAWRPVGPGVVARLRGGRAEARSLACTHAGCPVQLGPEGFACPCHGGRYDLDGNVLAGPPPAPLPALPVASSADGWTITVAPPPTELRADHVILAVDAPALGRLAGELLPATRGLSATRVTVARFWLDRDVDRRARAAVLLDGFPHACNAFLVHRLQDEARAWAAATGGAVIELQATRDIPPDDGGEALLDRLQAELPRVWPELGDAEGRLLASVVKRHLTDSPTFTAFLPGWHQHALPVDPGVPGLLVAGDHVLLEHDAAFMELAVLSGRLAANAVLAAAGLPLAPILPPAGA